ncbi:MAG: stringent starvation family protein [Hyphomicrobiales bacterium]|jgi:hypothetical protein|nr:stringent starvation family protein [Hyphomicrobiales bacterium]
MTGPVIRYDLLVQDALLGVVRKVLMDAAREGTPGDHHFYVTFKTQAPGVQLSSRMKAKYPEEITIVLQHQYWDLTVSDQQIEVSLSFNNIPEKLVIPFEAITGFEDPTAPFGLKFEPLSATPEAKQIPEELPAEISAESQNRPTPITAKSKSPAAPSASAKQSPKADKAEKPPLDKTAAEKPGADKSQKQPPADDQNDGKNDGKIVSIDAFRKKT